MQCKYVFFGVFASIGLACCFTLSKSDDGGSSKPPPILIKEDFEKGASRWQMTDPKAWKIDHEGKNHVLNQFKRRSNYKPPHRSPLNIALLKKINVGSFQFDAKVKSTIKSGAHRDVCMFFNYQNPAHFYYVHFGQSADPHANQIFIVNGADRKKISITTTKGTPWDDKWHHVRIIRDVGSGDIKVYFDDMKKPVKTANDKNFLWGRVGIGSFDDTALWDDIMLRGHVVKK